MTVLLVDDVFGGFWPGGPVVGVGGGLLARTGIFPAMMMGVAVVHSPFNGLTPSQFSVTVTVRFPTRAVDGMLTVMLTIFVSSLVRLRGSPDREKVPISPVKTRLVILTGP